MALDFALTLKTSMMQQLHVALDAAAGSVLVIGTVGMAADLVSIPLALPSGAAASGKATFTVPINAAIAASGTAAAAEVRTGAGVPIVTGLSVGVTGAEDIVLSRATADLVAGDDLAIASFEIRAFGVA